MVTASDQPNVLRVSFHEQETAKHRSEIVCLVEATDHGTLKITYQHHSIQARPTGSGNWDTAQIFRHQKITSALSAVIRSNIMHELFSTFVGESSIGMAAV